MERERHPITSVGQWLSLRQHDLTASRIAALFSAHPFMTRDDLATQLRGGASQGDNPAMRAGRILEPAVAAALAEDHPDWVITKAHEYVRIPELRLGCTPDYLLGDDALIQVKTVSPEAWEKWAGRVPLAYQLQTLTELIVTDRARGLIAVMVRSRSLPVYEFDLPRHPAAEARILDAVRAWWVAWPDMPETQTAEDLAMMLDNGNVIDLGADNELPELLERREQLKIDAGETEVALIEIDTEIKAKIGVARMAVLPGWRISYGTQHRKEFVVKAKDIRVLRIARTERE